jgi:hypothetical protein
VESAATRVEHVVLAHDVVRRALRVTRGHPGSAALHAGQELAALRILHRIRAAGWVVRRFAARDARVSTLEPGTFTRANADAFTRFRIAFRRLGVRHASGDETKWQDEQSLHVVTASTGFRRESINAHAQLDLPALVGLRGLERNRFQQQSPDRRDLGAQLHAHHVPLQATLGRERDLDGRQLAELVG